MNRLRIYLARRRLQRIVDRTRNSFECQDFAKRRSSMLKHTRSSVKGE
jgi:hypothetical protein